MIDMLHSISIEIKKKNFSVNSITLPQRSGKSELLSTFFALIDSNVDFDKVTNQSGFVAHYL